MQPKDKQFLSYLIEKKWKKIDALSILQQWISASNANP